jgi:hypothetical protein
VAKLIGHGLPSIAYLTWKQKKIPRNHFQVDFISMKFSKSNSFLIFAPYTPMFILLIKEKVADGTWFGGYINSISLVNLPKNPGQTFFVNNPVSYTISKSLGPSMTYSHGFKNDFNISSTIQMATLSYVIQPIYGHPYPEKYLEEGVLARQKAKWLDQYSEVENSSHLKSLVI